MTTETGTYTPTDEDVERSADALIPIVGFGHSELTARAVLATIGPIIERERRAAYEQGMRDAFDFSGGEK